MGNFRLKNHRINFGKLITLHNRLWMINHFQIFDYLQNMKSWETVLNVQNKARQYFSINYKSLQGSSNLCKFFKVHVSGQVDKAFWGPLDLQMSNLANMGRVLFMRCK